MYKSMVMDSETVSGSGRVRHLLTGEELSHEELEALLIDAERLKEERRKGMLRTELAGRTFTLLFDKPSLRTRLSFSIAVQELGGMIVESVGTTRKQEEPEDVAGVLSGYCHGIVLRTHSHALAERMASRSKSPIINALTDSHHPCQVLADLLTLKERKGRLQGLKLAYLGDGNNMLHSLALLLPALGVSVQYSCPDGYQPDEAILSRARARAVGGATIQSFASPKEAVEGADALYTDVWTSMGFEGEKDSREAAFQGYQLNGELYGLAAPDAVVMHCMPIVRGQEITDEMADHPNAVLYQQSENRLHVQKALLRLIYTPWV